MHYELGLRDHLVPMLHGVDCQVSRVRTRGGLPGELSAHTIHTTTLYVSAHSPCLLGVFLHFCAVFCLPAELLHRRRPRLHAAHTGVMHKCDAVLL